MNIKALKITIKKSRNNIIIRNKSRIACALLCFAFLKLHYLFL